MSDKETIDKQELESLRRPVVPELDEVLGVPMKVLDDGFVRVVDYMGSDASIVQAARVSYGAGTKKVTEDRGLIRYLMRHRHTTPLEMCEIKLHVRVPMDCWRQWIRHRTANVNEYSTRYSIAIDATQTTAPDEWRVQSPGNRQGSSGMLDSETGSRLSQEETKLQNLARKIYEDRLEHGVAREQARKDLPLSTYTEAYWKVDLHNMFHFLSLRMDDHSQYEIRCYAKTIGDEIVRRWCPIAWEAFVDYGLQRMGLTGLEIPVVQALASGDTEGALKMAEEHGWLKTGKKGFLRNRERSEFEDKLRRLNFSIPWEPSAPID